MKRVVNPAANPVADRVVDPDDRWRSAGRLLIVSVGAGITVAAIAFPLLGAVFGVLLGPLVQLVNITVFGVLGGFSGRMSLRRTRLVLFPVPVVGAFVLSGGTSHILDDFATSSPPASLWPLVPTLTAAVITVAATPWCVAPLLRGKVDG